MKFIIKFSTTSNPEKTRIVIENEAKTVVHWTYMDSLVAVDFATAIKSKKVKAVVL